MGALAPIQNLSASIKDAGIWVLEGLQDWSAVGMFVTLLPTPSWRLGRKRCSFVQCMHFSTRQVGVQNLQHLR